MSEPQQPQQPKAGSYVTIRCQARGVPGGTACKGNMAIVMAKMSATDILLQSTATASFQCCTCKGIFTISY